MAESEESSSNGEEITKTESIVESSSGSTRKFCSGVAMELFYQESG